MSSVKSLLPLLLVLFGLSSCLITESVRNTQIEIMKPGIFVLPDDLDTVAIFNRDLYKSDTAIFSYFNGLRTITDTTIRYDKLANDCVDALSAFFEQEKYFGKVMNYRDSLKGLQNRNDSAFSPAVIFEKSKADLCIFLDYFKFDGTLALKFPNIVYTSPALSWTLLFKTDSTAYMYNQIDTLTYEGGRFPEYFTGGPVHLRPLLKNAAQYLGRYFGTKMVPTWIKAERMYYKSNNENMLRAEVFALNNDWLKAAEIWNREAKNKNQRIAAKASFNMALACEMEGKPDLAIDWLIKSYSCLPGNNEGHKANCQRYISVLTLRKKEIQKLDKQVRN